MAFNVEGRHPSTQHFAPLFEFEHLPEHLQGVSAKCADLRKLLEAKDCFVRAALTG